MLLDKLVYGEVKLGGVWKWGGVLVVGCSGVWYDVGVGVVGYCVAFAHNLDSARTMSARCARFAHLLYYLPINKIDLLDRSISQKEY